MLQFSIHTMKYLFSLCDCFLLFLNHPKHNLMRCTLPFVLFCIVSLAVYAQPQASGTCTLTMDIKGLGNHRAIISYSPDTVEAHFHRDTVRASHGHLVYTTRLSKPEYAY